MVTCLFAEAFVDGQVASHLEKNQYTFSKTGIDEAARIVNALLEDPGILHEVEPPRYWLERQFADDLLAPRAELPIAFFSLIEDFCEGDYFPTIMPKPCVDDHLYQSVDLSKSISDAIGAEVSWPSVADSQPISDDILFSVIEFFHDRALRPRTRSLHPYANCGWHYDNHNRESGAAVYRWRVNELLGRYKIGFRLGNAGAEKGRMIRYASQDLDDFANQLASETALTQDQKIAEAIRLYRSHSSSVHNMRAAVAQLSGYLENNRKLFKAREMTSGDEADLFNIFNNFYIRHDNDKQKKNFGVEYLDWIFWTTLAAIHLLQQLDDRESH